MHMAPGYVEDCVSDDVEFGWGALEEHGDAGEADNEQVWTFDWDDDNVAHIDEHRVDVDEVIDVFYGPHLTSRPYVENGEERRDAIGMTLAGRLLKVPYTQRNGKLRPCTAYDAGYEDRISYRKRYPHGK